MSANPVQIVELKPAAENNPLRKGDGTFESRLETAKKNLEEKEKQLMITPWSRITELFDILKLEFDFKTEKIDQEPSQFKPAEKTQPQTEQTNTKPEEPANKQIIFESKNTERLKEILSKNIPAYRITLPVSPFTFNIAAGTEKTGGFFKSDLQSVIDEIVKQAKFIKSVEKSELSLALSQQDLGEMYLTLAVKNGHLAIQITANSETKKLMEENLDELKLALKESKISLDSIRISEAQKETRNEGGK